MDEGEFAEVFAFSVKDALPTGWTISALDIGEVVVEADHGQVFRLSVYLDDDA